MHQFIISRSFTLNLNLLLFKFLCIDNTFVTFLAMGTKYNEFHVCSKCMKKSITHFSINDRSCLVRNETFIIKHQINGY